MLADNHKDNVENVEIKYVIYNRIEKKIQNFHESHNIYKTRGHSLTLTLSLLCELRLINLSSYSTGLQRNVTHKTYSIYKKLN